VTAADQVEETRTWYTETAAAADKRPTLGFDLDVDVCVVGAGLAGLTTAREIARGGWSVAVLEARRIAWNASGRNCGFVLPGFAESMPNVVRRVGLDHARKLWALSEEGVDYVRAAVSDMPAVDPVDGWLKVSKFQDAERDLALLRLLGQDFGAEVEGWPVERVREVLRSENYFHGIHFPRAFHVHPLNYALGLAAAAEAAGARIFEHTPVLSIDAEGVRKRVQTPSARVRAGQIVLAGNVHLGDTMPRLAGTLLPVWTYTAVTAPLGPALEEAVSYRGGVSDTELADSHYRIVGGDRLLWAGRMTTWAADPRRFRRRLQADIAEIYPQLGEVEIEHVWSGVLGIPLHRMPQIGEFSPGLWIASGFAGHGLNTTAMAGCVIARALLHGDDTWRLFLPYELVWAGGGIGRAAMQVYYQWYRGWERGKARESREREKVYSGREPDGAPPIVQEPSAEDAAQTPAGHMQAPAQDALPVDADAVPPMASPALSGPERG
jgi:glycine/D-amino acid oxidase-like deaminating enzyme